MFNRTTTNKVGARLRFLPPSVKYWLKASTKKTSMPMGSQNGWIDNLNKKINATSHKIRINNNDYKFQSIKHLFPSL